MKVLAARGVKPRLRGMGAPEIIVCCHIKALLLNPPQGEAGERSRFSAPASGGNVVNNMNGEKQ